MKTIIAGSRTITDPIVIAAAITASGFDVTLVVSGGCRGADLAGENWAMLHGIPVKQFPAPWRQHGLSAGPIRNKAMADYADALIAVWDGVSRGTKNMIQEARKRGLKVYVHLNSTISAENK